MRPVDSGGPVSIPPVASTPRAPKPPAEVPAPVPGQKYEIQKGDTLWAIAKRAYKVNDHDARGVVDGIAKKNGLSNPDAIATGAFLQLPLPGDLSSFSPAVSKKLVDLQGGATAAVPPAAARPTNAQIHDNIVRYAAQQVSGVNGDRMVEIVQQKGAPPTQAELSQLSATSLKLQEIATNPPSDPKKLNALLDSAEGFDQQGQQVDLFTAASAEICLEMDNLVQNHATVARNSGQVVAV